MPPNRDSLSSKEVRAYAVLQGICWALAVASFTLFALAASQLVKWSAVVAMVVFLLGAVVFNWARRFGVRVLWSERVRRLL